MVKILRLQRRLDLLDIERHLKSLRLQPSPIQLDTYLWRRLEDWRIYCANSKLAKRHRAVECRLASTR